LLRGGSQQMLWQRILAVTPSRVRMRIRSHEWIGDST
jgi:hypothetical protein